MQEDGDVPKSIERDLERSLERSVYMIVGVLAMVSLSGGIILQKISAGAPESLWVDIASSFMKELGIAGIVALLIIATIEQFTRSKHQKAADSLMDRIKTNLFYAIYHRHIPTEVFEEVERCLLTKNIIRRNYSVSYSLSIIPPALVAEGKISQQDADGHLFATVSSRYELHNISDGSAKAPIEMYLELPIDENLRSYVEIMEVKIDNSVTQIEPFEYVKSAADSGFKKETTISPHGSVKISLKARTIKRKTDMEVWASRLPSDGLKLQVVAPEFIEVKAKANHSSQLTFEQLDAQTRVWELESGIFPFQSVIFWWRAN